MCEGENEGPMEEKIYYPHLSRSSKYWTNRVGGRGFVKDLDRSKTSFLSRTKRMHRVRRVRWTRMFFVGLAIFLPLGTLVGMTDQNVYTIILTFVALIAFQVYFFFFDKG